MWTCNFDECQRPAVRTFGDCVLCDRHLCAKHLKPAFHRCPEWKVYLPDTTKPLFNKLTDPLKDADAYDPQAARAEERELADLIRRIDVSALVARASHLRQGVPCSAPRLEYDRATRSSVMGGMNYHVELTFDDGVKWIARIRRFNATSPPPTLRDHIVQSEVATLKFLERTRVPAPKVFDFALEGQSINRVGVGYILMEKLPGKSLRWSITTPEERLKVMDQLSDTFIELRNYPFNLLGSLDRADDPEHVGSFARESLTDFTKAGMRTIGPLASWEEYYKSSLRLILDLILRQEMYSSQAIEAYLIHRYLLDLVPSVLPPSSTKDARQEYFLKHADDKGDHVLVDDEMNITGIIDWEWAHTAPPGHAFNSPIGLLPVGKFYEGAVDLGDDEMVFARLLEGKGRKDLADCVWHGRLQHRFAFCCGYDLGDWDGFLGLFHGLRIAAKTKDVHLGWEEWKASALICYKDDAGLNLLLSRDKAAY